MVIITLYTNPFCSLQPQPFHPRKLCFLHLFFCPVTFVINVVFFFVLVACLFCRFCC